MLTDFIANTSIYIKIFIYIFKKVLTLNILNSIILAVANKS